MPNLENAVIYKIVDNTNNNIYIGSTCQTLSRRLGNHKNNYKNYLNGLYHYVTSFEIIKNGDYKIVLLEDCCDIISKTELAEREMFYITSMDCVNKQIPSRSKKQYYFDNLAKIKARNKAYTEENKEYFAEYKRQWNQANSDRLREIKREYNIVNKDKMDSYKRKYYEANRELINARNRQRRSAKKLAKQSECKKRPMSTTIFY